jgi:4-hydroxythreonine-4-phosphate dehydrogenase
MTLFINMNKSANHIILTVGEPAGIGPDIVIDIADQELDCAITAMVDPELMDERAQLLGSELRCTKAQDGTLHFGQLIIECRHKPDAPVSPGVLDPRNAQYVHDCISTATEACLSGRYMAMVTAPVHKGIINEAGITFSGHTELIAKLCGVDKPVMMLANRDLRVALVTTHLPLREVPESINSDNIAQVVRIVHHDLRKKFGIHDPRILVCGLNPHAGEDGHLGREEIDIITPCLNTLRGQGMNVSGPIPADTAFAPHMLEQADVVVAMYHDQGLPVIKASGFGETVNITLGLPIVRTSVDHGTALSLAGTGKAQANSLLAAIEQAQNIAAEVSA